MMIGRQAEHACRAKSALILSRWHPERHKHDPRQTCKVGLGLTCQVGRAGEAGSSLRAAYEAYLMVGIDGAARPLLLMMPEPF